MKCIITPKIMHEIHKAIVFKNDTAGNEGQEMKDRGEDALVNNASLYQGVLRPNRD